MVFSKNGDRLASSCMDGVIKVWDVRNAKELLSFTGHAGEAHGIAFSPDGTRLASAGRDEVVKVWDAATGRLLNTLLGHRQSVSSVVFSPDGKTLASSSMGLFGANSAMLRAGEVRVWDAVSGQTLLRLTHHLGPVRNVTFSADGRRLVTASFDGTARVWELEPRPEK